MNLMKEILESFLRKLWIIVAMWVLVPLINHGWLTSDLGKKIESVMDSSIGIIATAILGLLAPIVWGWYRWVVAKVKVVLAGKLHPADATTAEIAAQADLISPTDKVKLATGAGTEPIPAG